MCQVAYTTYQEAIPKNITPLPVRKRFGSAMTFAPKCDPNRGPPSTSLQFSSNTPRASLQCEAALGPAYPNTLMDCDYSYLVPCPHLLQTEYKTFIFISLHAFSNKPSKAVKEGREVQKGVGGPYQKSTILPDGPFGKHALSWFQWTRCSLPLKAIWMHRAFLALLETRLCAFDL